MTNNLFMDEEPADVKNTFSGSSCSANCEKPLAERMRPASLDDVAGQKHLLADGARLRRMIESGSMTSIILWGPPGTGKTTLARVIANHCSARFRQLSAVTAGVREVRAIAEEARFASPKRTIVFLDEIHRFSKAQQDVLLPFVEDGTILLVGATTEDPTFALTKALKSRSSIFRLESLKPDELKLLAQRAVSHPSGLNGGITVQETAMEFLVAKSNGDARFLLNALELAAKSAAVDDTGLRILDLPGAEACISEKKLNYDMTGEEHHDVISAFIKSVRGSDPDAAVYWLALMLKSGEDPRFIARRLVILASEDIGNADPNALSMAVSLFRATEFIGMPEIRINLAQVTLYMACAPKSNASYIAISEAMDAVENQSIRRVPSHLRPPSRKDPGEKEYLYPHDYPGGWVKQEYMPDPQKFYRPVNSGFESRIAKFVESLDRPEKK